MRIITGYMPATSGKAMVAGYDVFEQPLEAKRRTGYLPETPPLYPGHDRARVPDLRREDQGRSAAHVKDRVDEVMKRTWVADMADRHCAKLSKGYRQRVGLAQAIIHNPEVLVLDEPTAGLDPKQIIETRQLIRELAGTHTIVLSTHILPEVSQTCQRVVIINKGKVVAVDSPDNLTPRLQGAATVFVQADGPADEVEGALQNVRGVTRVTPAEPQGPLASFEVDTEKGVDVRRELAAAVVTRGWGLLELRPMRMSLEDIFLSVTTEETDEPAAAAPRPRRRRWRMRNVLAIAGKELRGYFASPIGYVLVGFYALLFGWFFYTLVAFFERQSMQMRWAARAAR